MICLCNCCPSALPFYLKHEMLNVEAAARGMFPELHFRLGLLLRSEEERLKAFGAQVRVWLPEPAKSHKDQKKRSHRWLRGGFCVPYVPASLLTSLFGHLQEYVKAASFVLLRLKLRQQVSSSGTTASGSSPGFKFFCMYAFLDKFVEQCPQVRRAAGG